jgi:pimeloyl-[acyl-carrier protein] methyl ester esterase
MKRTEPLYILLPGLDGTGELFAPFYEILPHSVQADMVRYRPDTPQPYTEIIDRVYARLPHDRPFVLVAESFSGPIATVLAQRAERDGLALVAIVYAASYIKSPLSRLKRLFLNNPFGRFIHARGSPLLLQGLMSLNGCDDFAIRHRIEALIIRAYAQVIPSTRALRLQELLRVDCSRHFTQLKIPILYLLAKRDRVVSVDALVAMQKLRNDITVVEIDAPHRMMQTNPVDCWQAIGRFIEGDEALES